MSYTPGPWKVEHNKRVEVKQDTGEWSSMIAHVYQSGTVNGNNYYMPAEANARLIAAAPELLEALVKLISLTQNTDDLRLIARVLGGTSESAEKYIQYADEVDIAIEQARAVIAKARGG